MSTWFLWEEGVKTLDSHRRSSAVCGERAPAQCVFNRLRCVDSGMETGKAVASPENGSVNPSGSFQGDNSDYDLRGRYIGLAVVLYSGQR